MLAVGQERMSGEKIGVPERKRAVLDTLDDKPLPDVIFQNQVGEEGVMRKAHAQLVGEGRPGRAGE